MTENDSSFRMSIENSREHDSNSMFRRFASESDFVLLSTVILKRSALAYPQGARLYQNRVYSSYTDG